MRNMKVRFLDILSLDQRPIRHSPSARLRTCFGAANRCSPGRLFVQIVALLDQLDSQNVLQDCLLFFSQVGSPFAVFAFHIVPPDAGLKVCIPGQFAKSRNLLDL